MNVRQWFCKHNGGHDEIIHGCFEDEPGGPRSQHYISWQCRKCRRVVGDPLDRNDYPPEVTTEMKKAGLVWTRVGEDWRMIWPQGTVQASTRRDEH